METDKKIGNDFIRNYMRYLKLERSYSLNTLEVAPGNEIGRFGKLFCQLA